MLDPVAIDALKALKASLGPDRNVERMHFVANRLDSSPYKRDSNGRLRRNGRYVSKP